ncbi:MAG: DNA-processing protein DprA, partial [Deltaproteobacteria bacterium]|nr:DNA-processing protein DprA [Deltaproteobacteria bacterium]
MDRDKLKYYLALYRIRGLSPERLREAIRAAKGARSLFTESSADYKDIYAKARSFSDWSWVDRELDRAEEDGVELVTIEDAAYPSSLREIFTPPLVLYTKGATKDFFSKALAHVAIIGTRKATPFALAMAENIAEDLTRAGVVVVSGLARGCDSAAHRGALKATGETIAVLGCGIDIIYPKENKDIYRDIADRGVLVSEFPFGTPPMAQNFPIRNRIVSGLSSGVLVIEAPFKSGAMMTARMALDGGREVMAMPGQPGAKTTGGSNSLLKDGATLIESAEDVLEALSITPGVNIELPFTTPVGAPSANRRKASRGVSVQRSLDDEEKKILDILDAGPLHIDNITQEAGMTVSTVLTSLLTLE